MPKEIRDSLGLEPGDELEFVEEDGRFYIKPHMEMSPFDAYVGYLKHLRKKSSDALVDELRGGR